MFSQHSTLSVALTNEYLEHNIPCGPFNLDSLDSQTNNKQRGGGGQGHK